MLLQVTEEFENKMLLQNQSILLLLVHCKFSNVSPLVTTECCHFNLRLLWFSGACSDFSKIRKHTPA